jgi:hypothetical protein
MNSFHTSHGRPPVPVTHLEHVPHSTILAAVTLAQQWMSEAGVSGHHDDVFSDTLGGILCGEGVYLSTKDLATLVAQLV